MSLTPSEIIFATLLPILRFLQQFDKQLLLRYAKISGKSETRQIRDKDLPTMDFEFAIVSISRKCERFAFVFETCLIFFLDFLMLWRFA